MHKILAFGFPCLTIAIITGSMWASKAWGAYWSWDPKETWSLITWFIYAALVHTRVAVGWRGRKASYLAIIGFLFAIITFLGVSIFLKGLHTYG
jgi:cytochrome c-type biogenesis protein CcsB